MAAGGGGGGDLGLLDAIGRYTLFGALGARFLNSFRRIRLTRKAMNTSARIAKKRMANCNVALWANVVWGETL